MTEISYKQFKPHITADFSPAPVYLIYGEEYLYKSVYAELVAAIVPENRRSFCLEELDGTDDNAHEAIERVNTFSLDGGAKVIGFVDANIFYSKEDTASLIQRLKTAVADGNLRKGTELFLKLLALLDIAPDTMTADDRQRLLQAETGSLDADPSWLDAVIACCRDRRQGSAAAADAAGALSAAIEKGFAPGNHLIITAETVDKRRKLYKAIKDHGIVIDCGVPARDTRADRARQEEALSETMRAVLGPKGKTMGPDAFAALRDMTGFNLRTFHNSLEKLAAFTGERSAITAADVAALMTRTKKDPIYELTGALFDKNGPQALFLLGSLLSGAEPIHPLQVVAAIVNQTRKLLVIRDFMDGAGKKAWRPGMPFEGFKQQTLPAIAAYDDRLREAIRRQEEALSGPASGKKSEKQKTVSSDLLIDPNPASPFPTYKTFLKADNFSRRELLAALTAMAETDRSLKSSAVDPRLMLETLIIRIVRPDLRRGLRPAGITSTG
ncbi:MAG: DNA polymerase III subunit delta [Thermodesulfobacteriota bacterium]